MANPRSGIIVCRRVCLRSVVSVYNNCVIVNLIKII